MDHDHHVSRRLPRLEPAVVALQQVEPVVALPQVVAHCPLLQVHPVVGSLGLRPSTDRRSCAQNEHPVLKKRSKHAPFACMTPVWPPIIISSSPRSSTRCGGCTFQSIKRTSSLVKAQAFPGGRTRWHTVGNRYRSVFSGCFWNADPREPPATL